MAAPAPMPGAYAKAKEELRAAATQDHLAKKAEATRSSASAAVEVIANVQAVAAERKMAAQDHAAGGAPASVPAGLTPDAVGGVVGGVVGRAVVRPWWRADAGADGTLQVTVRAGRDAWLVLLRRGPAGVTVLTFKPEGAAQDDLIPWHCTVRPESGEVLDLYRLYKPVPDPSLLPEIGPVDGLRVRIHPKTK